MREDLKFLIDDGLPYFNWLGNNISRFMDYINKGRMEMVITKFKKDLDLSMSPYKVLLKPFIDINSNFTMEDFKLMHSLCKKEIEDAIQKVYINQEIYQNFYPFVELLKNLDILRVYESIARLQLQRQQQIRTSKQESLLNSNLLITVLYFLKKERKELKKKM